MTVFCVVRKTDKIGGYLTHNFKFMSCSRLTGRDSGFGRL